MSSAAVVAVCSDKGHNFSKLLQPSITLIKGQGVEGDAHCGVKVKHRSRVAQNPDQPNLRQVHLLHSEFFDEVAVQGFKINVGDLGENITTRGIDLLTLPTGTRLHLGETAIVQLTGLRNPCKQIEAFKTGLLKASLGRTHDGEIIRKAGVMGIVIQGGEIRANDMVDVVLPNGPHIPMERI